MKVSELFPSEYIRESDLKGRKWTLVMAALEIEEVWNGRAREERPVLSFCNRHGEPVSKRLVLNKTNADLISAVYGEETDLWIGKLIVIGPSTTRFRGEKVGCVRVDVGASKKALRDQQSRT